MTAEPILHASAHEGNSAWWLTICTVVEHWRLKPELGDVGLTLNGCRPFHFSLFSPHNIQIHLFPA